MVGVTVGDPVVGAEGAKVGDVVVGDVVVGDVDGEVVGDAVLQSTIVTPATKRGGGHPVEAKAYGPMVVRDAKDELASLGLYENA